VDPFLLDVGDQPPEASHEVDIDEKEQDHLEQLEDCLDVFIDIQELNNLVEAEYSSQLKNTEQLIHFILRVEHNLNDLVKRQRRGQINPKGSRQVVFGNIPQLRYLIAIVINKGRPKSYKNIQHEDQVNNTVQHGKCL